MWTCDAHGCELIFAKGYTRPDKGTMGPAISPIIVNGVVVAQGVFNSVQAY